MIYIIFYHKNKEPSNDIKNNKTELFNLNGKKRRVKFHFKRYIIFRNIL